MPTPIDAYIAGQPAPVRKFLQQVRKAIRAEIPGAVETISYGIPTFDLEGKHVVHFAAFARHVGFYPGRTIEGFEKDLEGYEVGRGSVKLPMDRPMPLDLVRRITRVRVAETLAKRPKKKVAAKKSTAKKKAATRASKA